MSHWQSRRDFLKTLGAGAAGFAGAATHAAAFPQKSPRAATAAKPNVMVILADDMGYSDVGCFGGEIRTPNIDRLAANGLRFTHFHNAARCCPSRASLLTGLYPHQTGVGDMMSDGGADGYRGDLNRRCLTLAELLRTAGYRTFGAGKWHVTRFLPPDGPRHNWPRQRGFDRYFGTITGAGSYYEPDTLVRGDESVEAPAGFFYTDAIAAETAGFVREHCRTSPGSPFFSYVAFTAPHWPLHAPADDVARCRGRFDKGWDVLRQERYARLVDMGIVDRRWRLSERDERVRPWADAPDKAWHARRMEVYAAQVERMDAGIGQILSALESCGVLDQTLILFLSDNGGCHEELTPSWENYFLRGREKVARARTRAGKPVRFFNDPAVMPGPDDTYQSYGYPWANLSNTPFRLFKHWTHAGGVATPLVAHWPAGIRARGELRHQHGHIIDIMATCVDISGASYPRSRDNQPVTPLEGVSLVPAFDGRPLRRDAIFWEHEGNRAVLTDVWKLVSRGARGEWELYDVRADRTETHDRSQGNPDVVRDLHEQWASWANRTGVLPRPR